jgi:IS5 family transposase
VALAALKVGKAALPDYSHPCSPKTFTQPQLFTCLVLKRFFDTDYRGIEAILFDMPDLRQELGLPRTPHFTTIEKAEKRLLKIAHVRRLLNASVELTLGKKKHVDLAAVDSTGMQSGRISPYFVRRRSREANLWQTTTYRCFPKLAIICDVATHLILSLHTGRGPKPDVNELGTLLDELVPHVRVRHLLADAGYDSESNHRYARDEHGILTTIPAKIGRPTSKPPNGYFRRLMHHTLPTRQYYGQRWQIETVNSMIKRNQGDAIRATSYHAEQREMRLAALVHNICILWQWVFYGAVFTLFQDRKGLTVLWEHLIGAAMGTEVTAHVGVSAHARCADRRG